MYAFIGTWDRSWMIFSFRWRKGQRVDDRKLDINFWENFKVISFLIKFQEISFIFIFIFIIIKVKLTIHECTHFPRQQKHMTITWLATLLINKWSLQAIRVKSPHSKTVTDRHGVAIKKLILVHSIVWLDDSRTKLFSKTSYAFKGKRIVSPWSDLLQLRFSQTHYGFQ